jgi:hypothetical protein
MCITRLASNEIFSPSNKIHREVGRAKNLSAPLYSKRVFISAGVADCLFTGLYRPTGFRSGFTGCDVRIVVRY